MTWRERIIVWLYKGPIRKNFYAWIASRQDRKFAKQEFDKVNGSGLGTLRRNDGSVIASPCALKSNPLTTIVIPVNRNE